MSVDLVVNSDLNQQQPQAVQDQNGNSSALYLSTNNQVSLNSSGQMVFGVNGDGTGEWIQNSSNGNTGQDYGIAFYANGQEWMRITNDGEVGIGTQSPSATFVVAGSVQLQGLASGSGTDVVADSNGNLFLQSSSIRFKENVRELKDDCRKLLGLKPVAFRHKDSGIEGIGYLAEDVAEQNLDGLVARDAEGQPFSVHYKLIPVYLVELVRQQQALIEGLQVQLAEVQARFSGDAAPSPAT